MTANQTTSKHSIPVGAHVEVTRGGVLEPWGETVVHRHDRNGTYRLRFPANDTYVTVTASELREMPWP